MTQMMLFDSPASTASSFAPTCVATAPVSEELCREPVPTAPRDGQPGRRIDHQRGVNHMGDLARLVLMRYDLVAKRKAILAARKAR